MSDLAEWTLSEWMKHAKELQATVDRRGKLLRRIHEYYKKHPYLMSLEMLEELAKELGDD